MFLAGARNANINGGAASTDFFLWHSDQEKVFFLSRKRTNPKADLSDCVRDFFGECSVNSVSHALQNDNAFHYLQFMKQQHWGVSRTSYLLSPYDVQEFRSAAQS